MSDWPLGTRAAHAQRMLDHLEVTTSAERELAAAAADRMSERAELLAMCKQLLFALASVQLIGGANDKRAALIKRCEGR
jgi:ammonia channel protein AmtB